MATLTKWLPDDKHMRLKALAKCKHISIKKCMEELLTQAIAEFDAETRFRAMASTTASAASGRTGGYRLAIKTWSVPEVSPQLFL